MWYNRTEIKKRPDSFIWIGRRGREVNAPQNRGAFAVIKTVDDEKKGSQTEAYVV